MMKIVIYSFLSTFLFTSQIKAQTQIIFRGDDMGFSHSANLAHIDAYQNGVIRSVEVIVPGPWFEEAVQLLNENPELDVGVHLALTSEWRFLKWKPLTCAPSLVDEKGYFYQTIWPNENQPGKSLNEHNWSIEEVEQELRAQIEMAIKRIPQVTHFTGHMGCTTMSEEVKELTIRLAKEYGLDIVPETHGFERLPRWGGKEYNQQQKTERLAKVLKELKPGKYLSVTHPAYLNEETRNVNHAGYENVGADRDAETKALTDPSIQRLLEALNIEVIGYKDLR
jgi:predicted glycoside hydrolase/deacetylase ChbG (UPF0249 family)